ncbi:ADP-ribosyl cyclase/cyclic ADP-ribose hydrolase [Citrus sinensis]|uniref:ADP-ribosyl cyclase/cyclic ADP-ribose hydrolase n=1 Tax=Citrus sinensis TaxID=2711 RepID=A0ACB8M903_CITSI|nr:ADP-ribosyl cyclase/cyclic ADP-ribose hydrolase [Citrus sinensis]
MEPKILKELVGMESRLEKLRFLMGTGSNGVRMIGIWGMGGLGKTTLARVVYDLISYEFDGRSFLANVREKSKKEGSEISLQKQLLSDLLKLSDYSIQNVYDGINIIGSRLRRKKILLVIDDAADVEQLQSLAGKHDWLGPGSKILITTRDRQLLVAHEVNEEHILNLDVLNNDEALQLCSMKAFKTYHPVGEYVELSERFLKWSVELGQLIVTRQSPEEPGKRSRLWRQEEVRHVLRKNTGSEVVEGIIIDDYFFPVNEVHLSAKAFSLMTNLGLLKINNVQLLEGLEYLSNKLRLLDWHRYPLKSLPSNLQLDKIVEFKMCYSRIEELWKGIKLTLNDCKNLSSLPVAISSFQCLRNLKLSGCSKLKKFPQIVTTMEDLSELNLDGTSITEVPSSIELLPGLELLNLNDCKNFARVPSSINGLKSLKTLNLSGCCKLENVPDTLGQVESLEELDISETAVRRPPSSVFLMKNLRTLSFSGCNGPPSSASWHLHLPFNLMGKSSCLVALMLPSLSGALKLCKSNGIVIECIDSLKLLRNNGWAILMLREYLEAVSDPLKDFSTVIPGSKIPKWFMYQNEGSSITVTRPSYLYNMNKIVGYAICCVFHVPRHSTRIKKRRHSYELQCCMDGSDRDFTRAPHLEELNFEGFTRLCEFTHFCSFKEAEFFEFEREFPEKTSSKDQLLEIHLEGTAIRGLPASIELLSGNVLLNLKDRKNLKSLPSTINGLRSLRMLHLSGCSKLKNAPETLGKVESLEKDSDSWKKNVDKGIKLSTTAVSACSLACHRLIQISRAMPKS